MYREYERNILNIAAVVYFSKLCWVRTNSLPLYVVSPLKSSFIKCKKIVNNSEIVKKNYIKKIKVNAPVAGRLRNFYFSFESKSLINQPKFTAVFNIII